MSDEWNPNDVWEQANHPEKYAKGSRARDAFKYWHKSLGRGLHSIDLDFVFVDKAPYSGIIAVLDYKRPNDNVSYAEVLAYNQFVEMEIPVFIVEAEFVEERPFENLTVKQFIKGTVKPYPNNPEVELQTVLENGNQQQFKKWEQDLRFRRKLITSHWQRLHKRIERLNEQYRVFLSSSGKVIPPEIKAIFEQWRIWIQISKDF